VVCRASKPECLVLVLVVLEKSGFSQGSRTTGDSLFSGRRIYCPNNQIEDEDDEYEHDLVAARPLCGNT
jgi:hypothetical protein